MSEMWQAAVKKASRGTARPDDAEWAIEAFRRTRERMKSHPIERWRFQ